MFPVLGGTLELNLLILGLHLGTLGVHFDFLVFSKALVPDLGRLLRFFWKRFETCTKETEKGELEWMHFKS